MRIIDCHCHYGTGDGLTGPWNTRAALGDFMRWNAEAGITQTVLFAAMHSDYSAANAEVAAMVRRHPDKFFGFCFVHAERDAGRIMTMVEKAVHEYGFRGIKVHRRDARISREICEAARRFRIPVLYDVYGETAPIELFASEYRDVNFIIPHLSTFADDWSAQLAFIDHLVRHPNVYTDTSGVKRFDMLQMAMRRAGPGKILFGTDGPWLHPGVELSKIRYLHLDDVGFRKVTSGNILRLMGTAVAV
ncbi:amidohydrolase family protein [Chitinophaga lutea]